MSLPPAHCIHLKTTSATTGAPRFVAFTAEQLAADAENIVATMGLRPDWPNVAAISLAHSYGFSNLVLPLLLHGIPLFIAPSPLPEIFRQAINRAKVPALTLPAVPALWRAWHAAGVIPANVRLAICAGAPLPLALETGVFSATGIKIHNFYGSSECGGIAYDATPVPRTEESCAGKPMRNVDLQIGEAGCLEVRGKAVGETYWPTPSSALKAGCFKTSDLAEIINGEVHLRGRLADQINVAGRKVSPAAIEQVLLEHDQVAECLAFGVPSADADRAEVHRRLHRGKVAGHRRGVEAIFVAEDSGLANPPRMVVCGLSGRPPRQGLPRNGGRISQTEAAASTIPPLANRAKGVKL